MTKIEIALRDSFARGRNGEFEPARLLLERYETASSREQVIVMRAYSKRRKGTYSAPIRLEIPGQLWTEIAFAIFKMLNLNAPATTRRGSGDFATEGMDPTALERIGRGGLTKIMADLVNYRDVNRDVLIDNQETRLLDLLNYAARLLPAVEKDNAASDGLLTDKDWIEIAYAINTAKLNITAETELTPDVWGQIAEAIYNKGRDIESGVYGLLETGVYSAADPKNDEYDAWAAHLFAIIAKIGLSGHRAARLYTSLPPVAADELEGGSQDGSDA